MDRFVKTKMPRFLNSKEDPLEKKIEQAVCKYGLTLGLAHRKYANPSRRGAPDQIFFRPCKPWTYVFFIEFKSRGKTPTSNQLEEQAFLRALGFQVFVIDNIEDGKRLLDIMC
jgi:hypothetical protein